MKKENKEEFLIKATRLGFVFNISAPSVLDGLRKLSLDPLNLDKYKIKGMTTIEFSKGNKKVKKMYNIPMFKRLMNNDITRQIISKMINQTLNA